MHKFSLLLLVSHFFISGCAHSPIGSNATTTQVAAEEESDSPWIKQSFDCGIQLEAPAKLELAAATNIGKGVEFKTESVSFKLKDAHGSFQLHSTSFPNKDKLDQLSANYLADSYVIGFKCKNLVREKTDGDFVTQSARCVLDDDMMMWMKYGKRGKVFAMAIFMVDYKNRKNYELPAQNFIRTVSWK